MTRKVIVERSTAGKKIVGTLATLPKSRGGRPRNLQPQAGHRRTISVRVTANLRHLLDQAAEYNGKSLSQEAERRLDRSFDTDEVMNELRVIRDELRRWRPQ